MKLHANARTCPKSKDARLGSLSVDRHTSLAPS